MKTTGYRSDKTLYEPMPRSASAAMEASTMKRNLLWAIVLFSAFVAVFGAHPGRGVAALGSKEGAEIQEAQKAVDRAKKKWEQLQHDRDSYVHRVQDVGTRWASTTLKMYWLTRSKEMREKELKQEEDDAYWEWWLKQKGRPADVTKEQWKKTPEGQKLIEKNDRIRSELGNVYIKAINDLDKAGFKGDDGEIQALDLRQKEILTEYQRARERLEALRRIYSQNLSQKAVEMTFGTFREDYFGKTNEALKILFWVLDGTPPFKLRVSSADGEISQEMDIATNNHKAIDQFVVLRFAKPGTRTVYLDLEDSGIPRQKRLLPLVFHIGEAAESEKGPEEKAAEETQGRTITLVSATSSPPSVKTGQPTFLKFRCTISGVGKDEKLTAATKLVATGPDTFPFPGRSQELSGALAVNGKTDLELEANVRFAKAGNYKWNYTIEIPGYEPLKGSVPFTVESSGGAASAGGEVLPSKWTTEGTVAGPLALSGTIKIDGDATLKSFTATVDVKWNIDGDVISFSKTFDGAYMPSGKTGTVAGTFDWQGPIKYVKLSPGSTYGTATLKGTVSAGGITGTLDNSWAWKGSYQNTFTTGPLGAR